MATHDVTAPLPSVRIGVNVSSRLVLDLTVGALPQWSSSTAGGLYLSFGAGYRIALR